MFVVVFEELQVAFEVFKVVINVFVVFEVVFEEVYLSFM